MTRLAIAIVLLAAGLGLGFRADTDEVTIQAYSSIITASTSA